MAVFNRKARRNSDTQLFDALEKAVLNGSYNAAIDLAANSGKYLMAGQFAEKEAEPLDGWKRTESLRKAVEMYDRGGWNAEALRIAELLNDGKLLEKYRATFVLDTDKNARKTVNSDYVGRLNKWIYGNKRSFHSYVDTAIDQRKIGYPGLAGGPLSDAAYAGNRVFSGYFELIGHLNSCNNTEDAIRKMKAVIDFSEHAINAYYLWIDIRILPTPRERWRLRQLERKSLSALEAYGDNERIVHIYSKHSYLRAARLAEKYQLYGLALENYDASGDYKAKAAFLKRQRERIELSDDVRLAAQLQASEAKRLFRN